MYRADVLLRAWTLAKANNGAPGVDGESFEDIESKGVMKWLEGLGKELHDKTTTADKLLYAGYTDVVDADLSKYFDTIPHSELMQSVARRIVDKHMLHLIKMWLKVPVEERDEKGNKRLTGGKNNDRGTPQGGVMTPRTQKITSNLSACCRFGGNRVRIDVCRIRLYVYDRCHAPANPRKPSASIARATCCCVSITSPMLSSSWRASVPYRGVRPIATWSKLRT